MEYLKIAQDLEMYGVNYFAIRVSWVGWGSCCPARVISMSWRARRAGRWHLGTPPVPRGGSSSWYPVLGHCSGLAEEKTVVHV